MIETQVAMTVSDFSGYFSRNHFLEAGLTFQWEGVVFQFLRGVGGTPIGDVDLIGEGGGSKKS